MLRSIKRGSVVAGQHNGIRFRKKVAISNQLWPVPRGCVLWHWPEATA